MSESEPRPKKDGRGGAGRGQGRKKRVKPQERSGPLVTGSVAEKRNLCQRALDVMDDPKWSHCTEATINPCMLCLLVWDARKKDTNRHWTVEMAQGKAVHHVNHMHDKPIEHNVTISIAETIQKARKRAGK